VTQSSLHPRTITHSLTIQHVGLETLIYDERRHQAFCLNPVSSAVWALCDGSHSPAEIAVKVALELKHPVSEGLVLLALEELRRDALLVAGSVPVALADLSRREIMRKLGTGAALLLPAIAMIAAPRAAEAYNGGVDGSPQALRQRMLQQQQQP
jgi:hypothetical protein